MKLIVVAISAVILSGFMLGSCSGKSQNELEYDSLAAIIVDGQEYMLNTPNLRPALRDSMENLYDDMENLNYFEMKLKYELSDSANERAFLDAIGITAQIITILKNFD